MLRIFLYLNFILMIPSFLLGQSESKYELFKTVEIPESAVSLNVFAGNDIHESQNIVVTSDKTTRWLNTGKPEIIMPEGYLKTVFSNTGKFFCFVSMKTSPENTDLRNMTFDVHSNEDGQLYTLQKTKHYDDSMPLITISDENGSLFLGQNYNGKIYFYDENGNLVRETDLFAEAEYDLERVLACDLDAKGEKLAIVAGIRGAAPLNSTAPNPSAEPQVFLFTTKGEKLWQQPLPELNTSMVKISDDGKYVVADCYTLDMSGNVKKRCIVFENGKEILNTDILFKHASFSEDSGNLILADNTNIRNLNLTSRKVEWRSEVSPGEGMITAVKINRNTNDAVLLIAKNEFKNGGFIFTNPRLRILNNTGNLQQEILFDGQVFKKPTLYLNEKTKKIIIGFSGNYQIYQVKK